MKRWDKWLCATLLLLFFVLTLFAQQSAARNGTSAPKEAPKKASAEDVCSFVAAKMRLAIPQVPTMCVPKKSALGFDLSVFSPTNVLEGKMRRAWSVALFEAAQELFFGNALNGTCQFSSGKNPDWFGCRLSISDSQMAQYNGMRYEISPDFSLKSLLPSDPSSEDWYQAWWHVALFGEKFDRPGSKGSAELMGKEACMDYQRRVEQDPVLKNLRESGTSPTSTPKCSLLLITDSSVYTVIDFPDFWSSASSDYEFPLLKVFGKAFAGTPYEGGVIFRTPWNTLKDGSVLRSLWSHDLRWLGFLWEEMDSGVRDDSGAYILLARSRSTGQILLKARKAVQSSKSQQRRTVERLLI